MLETYLKEKGLSASNISEIEGNLHRGVKARKELQNVEIKTEEKLAKKKERAERKVKTSHGTSCPRLMNEFEEVVIEL